MHTRYIDFEAVGEAAEAAEAIPAEAGAEPESALDDASAGDAVDSAPSPGEAPAWAGPSAEEWAETQQLLRELASSTGFQPQTPQYDAYTGQPLAQQQDAAPEMPQPWDENFAERMQEYLDWRDQQVIERAVGPMQPFVEHEMANQGRANLHQEYDRLKGEFGDFDYELAEALGDVFLARLGDPARSDEAVRLGAQMAAAERKRAYEQGQNDYRTQLERGQGARAEPNGEGVAVGETPDLTKLSYRQIAERHLGGGTAAF